MKMCRRTSTVRLMRLKQTLAWGDSMAIFNRVCQGGFLGALIRLLILSSRVVEVVSSLYPMPGSGLRASYVSNTSTGRFLPRGDSPKSLGRM
jgi:hypothetical protein